MLRPVRRSRRIPTRAGLLASVPRRAAARRRRLAEIPGMVPIAEAGHPRLQLRAALSDRHSALPGGTATDAGIDATVIALRAGARTEALP